MKLSYVVCALVGASSVAATNVYEYDVVSQERDPKHRPRLYGCERQPINLRRRELSYYDIPYPSLAGNLSRVLMTPTTRQWTPETGTSSQTTAFQHPVSSLWSTIDSEAYHATTQTIQNSHKTTQHVPATPAIHHTPTPVSTMTTVPPELLIQTLTGSEWKDNTWITTTGSDGSPTLVPVIVGCPGCKDRSGGGLLLWNLPQIPSVSFKFPNIPNLPQFFLPCVKILFVEIGNCPGPVTESTDDGKQQDDQESNSPTPSQTPSKTQSTTIYSSAVSSTDGCEVTRTASHCVATCSPTTIDRSSTITCFTIACHATITGCSVSGVTSTTTKMPCPTHDNANNVDRRDLGGDSCPMNCPQWSLYDWKSSDPVEDDQSDAKKRDFALAGRILVSRGDKSNVRKIGECRIETAWPAGKPVATPAYASGPEFLEADQGGFMNVDETRRKLSMEVPRWYSLRSAEAPACTPTTDRLKTQDMYNVMQRLKKSEEEHKGKQDASAFLFNNQPDRPSLDHLWEKSWATDFLLKSVLDDSNAAAPLADSPAYIFGSHDEGKRGTQNLIASVYNAMPSKNNLEFVGMTQAVNEKAKGLLWNPRNLNPEVDANMKDAAKLPVAAALKELDKKMNFLFTMQQGVWVSNIPKAIELMQRTNNRVYNEL
ncbi:hypothetical protein K456DRAFT_38823 [Colletotrichum gloeosporioides 23]|nr:hypothetical protein K456DRAFT_38823 [Colletotrichum gloeosporioides 23]